MLLKYNKMAQMDSQDIIEIALEIFLPCIFRAMDDENGNIKNQCKANTGGRKRDNRRCRNSCKGEFEYCHCHLKMSGS